MRIFVTGATGLLGNNAVRILRDQGHDVRALVRSAKKAERMLRGSGAEIVVGDMQDVDGFAAAIEGCDAVLHTAAYFREYYAPGEHAASLEAINVQGTLRLLAAADARGVRRFVHTSSSGAVGMNRDGSPGDEDTPALPEQLANLYFKSKVDGDAKIRAFAPKRGMDVLTILPGWMFGPGDAGPTSAGKLVLDFVAGKLPGVPPGGTCVVDARDVARAMVAMIEEGQHGDRFIVAGRFYTLREVLDGIAVATGKPRLKIDIPAPFALAAAHMSELWARITSGAPSIPIEGVRLLIAEHRVSSTKAERTLGVTFRPLAETMRDLVAWYRRDGMLDGVPVSAEAAAAL